MTSTALEGRLQVARPAFKSQTSKALARLRVDPALVDDREGRLR